MTNATPTFSDSYGTSYTSSPALPAGVVLNASTGIISGKPTEATSGSIDYTITATNPAGSASTDFWLNILPVSFITFNPPSKGVFNQSTTLSAVFDPSNNTPVTFWAKGKSIFHCVDLQPVSQQVTCNWKPNVHGMTSISASQSVLGVLTGFSNVYGIMIARR